MEPFDAMSEDTGTTRPIGPAPETPKAELGEMQIARNEALFRQVNEGIEEGRREREGLVPFVCECGELGCGAVIELTLREYESVRAGSRYFVIAPGHRAATELVASEHERYTVVRKPDGPAGDLADATDPRGSPA
jgi:hypothetical protein